MRQLLAVAMLFILGAAAPSPSLQERQEARADQDLSAQEGMQLATEEMVRLTKWQIALGWLTALGLGGTLAMTARSLRQTRESLELAANTARSELRAYVGLDGFEVTMPTSEVPTLKISYRLKNFGSTPAFLRKVSWGIDKLNYDHDEVDNIPLLETVEFKAELMPGATAPVHLYISYFYPSALDAHVFSDGCIATTINAVYEDVFGARKHIHFGHVFWGANLHMSRRIDVPRASVPTSEV